MDWCLDTRVDGASGLIESEIGAHLARHAVDPGVVDLALPSVRKALSGAAPGPAWVTLDWTGQECMLRVRDLPDEPLPGEPLGPGATRAHEQSPLLAAAHPVPEGTVAEETVIGLGVARPLERDIDMPPAHPSSLPTGGPGELLGLISAHIGRGASLEEAAARAGATMADAVHRQLLEPPPGADGAAARVVEAERRLGGDFEVVEADGRRAIVRNRRCPFGPDPDRRMCRFTSALAGGLAARSSLRSQVSVLESLAAGDRECRLVIDSGDGLDPRVAHTYRWPPVEPPPVTLEPEPSRRGFQVTLSLQLPRDRLSVPVTRHLVKAAMDEVGVVPEDGDAVQLAVTEACANVIDHSGPGDAYDVAVAINPAACHIRVVDVGRGFDHQALALSGMADQDAEHGRGVALMHALVDQVRFESEPEKGTVVHLVKRLTFREGTAAHRLMEEMKRAEEPPAT